MQPLLTTVSFLFEHILFKTFRIAIRPNWNNYCNITNIPTISCLSLMKRISGSHCFLHLFTNSTTQHVSLTALSLSEHKLNFCLVLQRVYVWKMYSSIALNLKFDWSLQTTWDVGRLENLICLSKHKYSLVQQHQI